MNGTGQDLHEVAAVAAEEAIVKTKDAQEAVEQSRLAQAALVAESTNERSIEMISEALRRVFGENENTGRFIDVSRIPLICQSINGIHESLKTIEKNMVTQDQFWPIKTLVYGATGTTLLAVIGGILALIIKK